MKKYCVLFFLIISFVAVGNNNILSQKDTITLEADKDKLIQLKSLVESELYYPELDKEKYNHMSIYSEIENVLSGREANRIAWLCMWIALISTASTCFIFLIQYKINKKLKKDTSIERFENNLFEFNKRLNDLVDNIEVLNVSKGRKSFNFLFYEYEMLFNIFKEQKILNAQTNEPLSREEISSLTISFIINGVTPNANGSDKDIIYQKYTDILSIDSYTRLISLVEHYKNLNKSELTELYNNRRYTFITNYANIELRDGKRVPWFWGIRYYYIPYIKHLNNIFMYIAENADIINKNRYYAYINASFNDTELGLLYAFINSRENYTNICAKDIELLIIESKLAGLYNYKTWKL